MALDYGFWFHYLLESTPGWWNDSGTAHVPFPTVAALAVSREVGTGVTRASRFPDIVVEAFMRKGWQVGFQVGFYEEIGGRRIVRQAVDETIFIDPANKNWNFLINADRDQSKRPGKVDFSAALQTFSARLSSFDLSLPYGGDLNGRMMYAFEGLLGHFSTFDNKAPWEWGNPMVGFRDDPLLKDFAAALSGSAGPFSGSLDTAASHVLYHDVVLGNATSTGDYYNLAFAVSKQQQDLLGHMQTCIRK